MGPRTLSPAPRTAVQRGVTGPAPGDLSLSQLGDSAHDQWQAAVSPGVRWWCFPRRWRCFPWWWRCFPWWWRFFAWRWRWCRIVSDVTDRAHRVGHHSCGCSDQRRRYHRDRDTRESPHGEVGPGASGGGGASFGGGEGTSAPGHKIGKCPSDPQILRRWCGWQPGSSGESGAQPGGGGGAGSSG